MVYEGGYSDLDFHLTFVLQMLDYVLGQVHLGLENGLYFAFHTKKYEKNTDSTFIRNLANDLVLKGS